MFGIKKDKQRLHANFRIGRIIGDGNFAIVRECVHRKSNKRYALKIINKAKVKGKEHMIENEIHILRKIIHPNIVKLHEEFETTKEIYLVMELVAGGDLFDSIVTHTRFSEPCSAFMIRDLASAVKYLHDLNIVHRDIKPENLLVVNRKDGRRSLKLADFGLSMEVDGPMFLVCGTPTYVAPEILDETGYGLKVDVWAIGVILYILLCGFPPFRSASHDQEELFDRIMRGDYEYLSPFWDDVSDGPKDLIDSLLKVDADDRYNPEEVLSHEWIRKWVEPFDTETTPAVQKPKPTANRKSFRGISIAIQSLMCLLKLVRSKRQKILLDAAAETASMATTTTAPAESVSSNDVIKNGEEDVSPPHTPVSARSRIPRPKPSAGLHIAEIRKSIVTPTRGKREPECVWKNGILKRDEAIRRVNRSDSTKLYHLKTNPTVTAASKYAKIRPSSAVSIKRNDTHETELKRPCNPRRSKPSTPVQTDQDIQALLHKKLYGDSKIFLNTKPYGDDKNYAVEKVYGDKSSYRDNIDDEENQACEEKKAKYPENTAVVLTTKVLRKPSMDKTTREPPVGKSSTRFRPRSMLGDSNTVKASSEVNISSRTVERNLHERKKSYDNEKYLSTTKKSQSGNRNNHNKNNHNNNNNNNNNNNFSHSTATTPSPTKLTNGYRCIGSDDDQTHDNVCQSKCECPSRSHTSTNQTSSSSSSPLTDVENHSIHGNNSSSNYSNDSLNSNSTSNAIRKSRLSCRKNPSRKPVCRHASSIQSIPTEKYAPRRGLYRVKSLESNHVPSLNHVTNCSGVGVGAGVKGYNRTYQENSLPPWNPSTNLNNRFIQCSPREQQQQEKKNSPGGGVRTPRGLETRGMEPKCVTKATNDADKGIKITTEVNKRKNTKFPDGKTVDEEVKTTTTVSVNMESPEEEKETSLLTKVKNLALEIGSLAKETYKLSNSSDSSDSLEKENGATYPCFTVGSEGYTGEIGREDSSDLNDDSLASNKEETDIYSETEYLSSAFRKK